MDIVVMCRGSVPEGLGHLYRAMSFARAAEPHYATQIVALCEPLFACIFSDLKFPAIVVSSEEALASVVGDLQPDVCVIDMTDIADEPFRQIRTASPVLVSISPVLRQADEVDLFFTRGSRPPHVKRPQVYAGHEYAILNAHCHPISDYQFELALASPALPVMVSFGGADADNHSQLLLEELRQIEQPLLLWLMLGDGYLHSHDELVASIKEMPHHEIIMARTNRSMWRVAANCALAVLSSGMSTIEAMYAGLPVISVRRTNDPSRQVITKYDDLCLHGGDFSDGSYRVVSKIIHELSSDKDRIRALRERQKGVVDGLGTRRVLDAIGNFYASEAK